MTNLNEASVEQLEAALAAKKSKAGIEEKLKENPLPKMEEKRIFKVSYSDLEKWLWLVFGVRHSIVANEEWGNDESHQVNLNEKDTLDGYELEEVEAFLYSGKPLPQYNTFTLLSYLAKQGILPYGEYLIEIYW